MKKKLLAVILAAAAICGCVAPVYAADSELVLYTWEGMFPQEVLDGFEEETGCKIVYSNFDTDETMLEKVSMAKGGDYDVVIADDYILEKIVEEGLATKLDKEKLTNWGNINPLLQGFPEGGWTHGLHCGSVLLWTGRLSWKKCSAAHPVWSALHRRRSLFLL